MVTLVALICLSLMPLISVFFHRCCTCRFKRASGAFKFMCILFVLQQITLVFSFEFTVATVVETVIVSFKVNSTCSSKLAHITFDIWLYLISVPFTSFVNVQNFQRRGFKMTDIAFIPRRISLMCSLMCCFHVHIEIGHRIVYILTMRAIVLSYLQISPQDRFIW